MGNAAAMTDLYLNLTQQILINAIYQDRATDPWSQPVFDTPGPRSLARTGRSRRCSPRTRPSALRSLRECCELVLRERIPGDFVETGIWRGGACIMMAAVLAAYGDTERTVWGFDSFQGLPPPNEDNYPADRGDQLHRFPQLEVSIEEVAENFRRMGLWSDQVRLVKGWFRDTVPAAAVERIAVLRLDGDLYESTIQVLNGFYPKLSPGGFCIIDDYGAMLSCRAAVEDYRRDHGVTEPIVNRLDGKGGRGGRGEKKS